MSTPSTFSRGSSSISGASILRQVYLHLLQTPQTLDVDLTNAIRILRAASSTMARAVVEFLIGFARANACICPSALITTASTPSCCKRQPKDRPSSTSGSTSARIMVVEGNLAKVSSGKKVRGDASAVLRSSTFGMKVLIIHLRVSAGRNGASRKVLYDSNSLCTSVTG